MNVSDLDDGLGAPVQPAPGVLVLNASRMRDFRACRRRYFLSWVVGLRGDDDDATGAADRGRRVHAELHARHAHPQRHDEAAAVDPEASGEAWIVDRALGHGALCPRGTARYIGGEVEARWFIARKALLVTGRFDAVWEHADGTLDVHDYKTGSCPQTLAGDETAAIYLLLAAASFGRPGQPVRVTYESLGGETPRSVHLDADVTRLRAAYEGLLDVAHHIRQERRFPATHDAAQCAGCAFRHECPHAATLGDAPSGRSDSPRARIEA